MKYHVAEEHDSHFVIHDGKGHFKVAKKGLSKELINRIQAMTPVKMADGGEVPNFTPDVISSLPVFPQSPQDPAQDFVNRTRTGLSSALDKLTQPSLPSPDQVNQFVSPHATPSPVLAAGQPDSSPTPNPTPSTAQTNTQSGQMPPMFDPMKGVNQYGGALMGLAKEQGKVADRQADIQKNYVDQMQKMHSDAQTHLNAISQENEKLFNDIQNQKIDPDRIWNNASTGSKISASIGLILGGMGAGLTHGPNQALQVMQNAIDRDVDAQKAELGKKQNLYHYNLQKYRDVQMAEDATRMQLATTAGAQMQQAALQSGNPLAIAQAKAAIAQFRIPYDQMAQQNALKLASLQNASPEGRYIRMMVPEKFQEKAFEQLDARDKMEKQKEGLLDAFGKIDEINTGLNRVAHLGFEPAAVGALRDPLLAQLVKDSEGRITPQDTEMIKTLFPAPLDPRSVVQTKRAQLEKFVNEKMNFNLLKGMGVPESPRGSFNQAPGTLPLNKAK